MKLGMKNFIITLLSILLFSMLSLAKGTSTQKDANNFGQKPEIIELKAKLEQAITKSYRDRISTQIDTNSFSVSAQVSLNPIPPANSKPGEEQKTETSNLQAGVASSIPADTNLGVIRLNHDFEKFKNEIKSNEYGKKALSDLFLETWMTQVQLTKVEVFVGLDENLDESYKKQFSDWLQKTVKSEFGAIGKHKIFVITNVKKIEPPKEPLTLFDQLSRFQVTLGLIFLSLMLLFVTLFFRFTTSKDIKEQNETALRIQEMKASQMAALHNANKTQLIEPKLKKELLKTGDEDSIALNLQVIAQTFRDLQLKLGYFLETSALSPQEITESWFAQGWQGRIKFASLIDSILTYGSLRQSNVPQTSNSLGAINNTSQQILNWVNSEKASLSEEQFEAFQEFPNISIQDRYKILEQAYWDILSIKMMGSQVLKARFSVLQDLSSDQIQEILSKQDPKLKTMAILHLPQPKIQKLFSAMNQAEKQNLLDESLKMEVVNSTDLELADETLKYAVQQNQGSATENGISFKSLIPNLLSSLTVQDEFKMLPSAMSKLSDEGLQLKKTFPSLAFVNEWPEEYLRVLFDQLEVKYIMTYLIMAPQMQEPLLKLLPPKSATIIADELKSGKGPSDQELDRNLTFLKTRLYQLINDEAISLSKIFSNRRPNTLKSAS